ncbi:MAG: DNA-3-methyladenine glycosylase [Melioribacteraceae bacterium]|nr:DNA-3-methyladenine glycosylase [Melioribacteraceae bacterium]
MAIGTSLNKLTKEFYTQDVLTVAKELLGKSFCKVNEDGTFLSGKIVEVEAYNKINDEAAHSFKGVTKRNEVMFMGGGHLYIYFIYGMYFCANVITGYQDSGSAVLIRGIEPLTGIDAMGTNRFGHSDLSKKEFNNLTNGPGKICLAYNLSKNNNGENLLSDRIFISDAQNISSQKIVVTTRIGIKKSVELPWRFFIKDNPFVSGK